ncbi:MAG: BadF/BadG/BcrA/BcrD ATPase family protein [Candidatus Sulfotelmatobacter sp.]
MSYYLGIDGGGSKTTCAVGDETALLATVTTGPSNIIRVGEPRARESLHEAISQACAAAHIDPAQITQACIGVAGAAREEVSGAVRKIVADLIPGKIEVVGDMEIAMEAAFGEGPGVIVIAGTGSIAYGRDAQGRTARAGGWGFAVSDEGSAHWIGRAAVAGLLRAIDDGEIADRSMAETTPFFRALRETWNVRSIDELVSKSNSNPDFAALFPAVLAAADAGDAVAPRVLALAGAKLAHLAGIVARRLFDATDASSASLAIAGGVFRHAATVRESFQSAICEEHPGVQLNRQVEPVHGALQHARKTGCER